MVLAYLYLKVLRAQGPDSAGLFIDTVEADLL